LAAKAGEADMYAASLDLFVPDDATFEAALDAIRQRGDPDMTPTLILAMRFARLREGPINRLLLEFTGEEDRFGWFDWMLWQEGQPDLAPNESFARTKLHLYHQIDPAFARFLNPQTTAPEAMRIRLEEITWGGVRVDGIPSLDGPLLVKPRAATYLRDEDLVFGVEINGDARAYPLRIMGWHEMFNDVIGGVPVALAYCTLCGAGILFDTQVVGRDEPFIFGSSGFLYRSNKLMYDRQTDSLWNQFTGKPVVGPLVDIGLELRQRPVTIAAGDHMMPGLMQRLGKEIAHRIVVFSI
jgi:hypothetical protein